jgi:hypothetical protein
MRHDGIFWKASGNIAQHYSRLVRWCERGLALVVLVGIVVAAVGSGVALTRMDWRSTTALDELIDRALLLVIGLELVRMLITHEIKAVLELLSFVIARKTLKPDLQPHEIALCALAFVLLLGAYRYLLPAPMHNGEAVATAPTTDATNSKRPDGPQGQEPRLDPPIPTPGS